MHLCSGVDQNDLIPRLQKEPANFPWASHLPAPDKFPTRLLPSNLNYAEILQVALVYVYSLQIPSVYMWDSWNFHTEVMETTEHFCKYHGIYVNSMEYWE